MADTFSLGIPESCPTHNFIPKIESGRFENYLAEMITTTRRCDLCKNHVARSKVKITVHNYSLCIGISCIAYNFILHGGN